MWFGLLPGPFTVIRAFTPRSSRRTRRRNCSSNPPATPMPTQTTAREQAWWWTVAGLLIGLVIAVNAANGWWFLVGFVLVVAAWAVGTALVCTSGRTHHGDPPAPAPPMQPQPAPLPDYPPSGPRSGHIPVPVNRELPADRPHPWRTWEG